MLAGTPGPLGAVRLVYGRMGRIRPYMGRTAHIWPAGPYLYIYHIYGIYIDAAGAGSEHDERIASNSAASCHGPRTAHTGPYSRI